jgi:hypothetical protein
MKKQDQILKNVAHYASKGLTTFKAVRNRHTTIGDSRGNVYAADKAGWRLIAQVDRTKRPVLS